MLYKEFPREMAFPKRKGKYRIVYNMKTMLKVINLKNGQEHIYSSVYSFKRYKLNDYGLKVPDYRSAKLDKLFFDFDGEDSILSARKLHKYLTDQDIKHCIIFSGNGIHIYVICEYKKHSYIYPSDTIRNAQLKICEEAKVKIGKGSEGGVDETAIGDLARVSRVPNTYNIKRKEWCRPISSQTLNLDFDKIKQHLNSLSPIIINGQKKFRLDDFDYQPKDVIKDEMEIPVAGEIKNISSENFWPCAENMIVKRSGNKAWFWATIWLRDMGYSKKETDKIMRKYLSKFKRADGTFNDYHHYKNNDNNLNIVFDDKKGKYWFPSANKLYNEKLCPGKCPMYRKKNCLYFME